MSVPNQGLAATAAYVEAEDPPKEKLSASPANEDDQDQRLLAPDQFDPQLEATKKEIYSYYAYYIGNNGLTRWSRRLQT